MKIAMIGLRGIPAKSGGIEAAVENLAPLLVKSGCEVTVYCRSSYVNKRIKSYKGVKLRYLPTINTKYTEAFCHTLLSSIDASFRDFDIIHYHATGNGLFAMIPKIFGKKTIITIHGLDWEREKWGTVAKFYLKFSERMAVRFCDKIISVSEKVKKYYYDKYGNKVDYIPNGINIVKSLSLKNLKKFHIEKNKYILFISRLVPEKGLQYLIPAFKKIKTDIKLLIVGDATHTDKFADELKKLAVDDKRIIFAGPLYGNDKTEAYSNALFFVLPSTIEGMSIVLLEAMSFGLCPLVSNIRENMDTTQYLGISFRSKSVIDLNNKLESVIKNPILIKRVGENCKNICKKLYNWGDITNRTLEVYNNI